MLRAADYRDGLELVQTLAAVDASEFAGQGVNLLHRLFAAEITTLSVCHLNSGRRDVIGTPHRVIGPAECAAFDRHFEQHPLVRYHAYLGASNVQRISDCMPTARFRQSPLYNDYYRAVGIDHAIAVPLLVKGDTLVSFVLNRRRRDFADRERDLLELLRGGLSALYRQSALLLAARAERIDEVPAGALLTAREREVLHWLAHGKTDRDIGEILAISPRTVHKHLQNVYRKLGVETRTAAIMRALRYSA